MSLPFCIIIPANNEAAYIEGCLSALLAQDADGPVRVIIAANACRDDTVARAEAFASRFKAKGWELICLDLPEPGKIGALTAAEAALPDSGVARAYLDADVLCTPALIGQVRTALATPEARYATGTLAVARARSWITQAYGTVWRRTPFVRSGAVGAGFFAVNGAGRARWGAFPEIISDDTFVRLHFSPDERIETSACYHWPMVEGLRALIRVRRRQDAGVAEIAARWPDLLPHEGKAGWSRADLLRTAVRHPIAMAIYVTVHVAVRFGQPATDWSRGR